MDWFSIHILKMIHVVLIGTENEGNLGAVARVMSNFSFNKLILIDPKCNHLSEEAIKRSKHAKNILKKANVCKIDELEKYDYVIATTSKMGTDYNIPRSAIDPKELSKKINPIRKKKIAILFGRESVGLTNKEISLSDYIVSVPTSKTYPAMNLSHSVAIILYELSDNKENILSHINMMSKKEKEIILQLFDNLFENMEFKTSEMKKTQKTIWKRIIGKSNMTKREAFAVIGFLKKIKKD
jgi:tRNA/rRNA methyltransferase